MNTRSLNRIDDTSYKFDISSENRISSFQVQSFLSDKPEFSYNLINSIYQKLSHEEKVNSNIFYFNYKNRIFKLHKKNTSSFTNVTKILSYLSRFFKNIEKYKNNDHYKLEEINSLSSVFLKLSSSLSRNQKILHLDSSETSTAKPFSFLKNTTRETTFLSHFAKTGAFSDPYTQLSTLAFQKYEKFYSAHDPVKGEKVDSDYALIETTQGLALIQRYQTRMRPRKERSDTIKNYHRFLIETYGKEKIGYIEKCYGIHLEEMAKKGESLTPEIIYRMNIGLGNLENQDVQNLYSKLQKLKELITDRSLDKEESVMTFLNRNKELLDFCFFEIKGILQILPEEANLKDLESFLNRWDLSLSFDQVKTPLFNQLIKILSPTPEEQEKEYTGRKIYQPITGYYTTGSKTVFKPWLDQQELLQVFQDIPSQSWDYYYEKLCHVICKKHLARQHPTDIYRVGALIPAPHLSGEPQWYKVTSLVNNGRGIVSYTLEPASFPSSLPAIKLYRSTALDRYALDSQSSVQNDLNPLNPPGYEGAYLSENYEMDFFKNRTIPTWVAYQHQANTHIQSLLSEPDSITPQSLRLIYTHLFNSTLELQKNYIQQHTPHSFAGFVKKYDAELIDLLREAYLWDEVSTRDFLHLSKILYQTNKSEPLHSLSSTVLEEKNKKLSFISHILKILPSSKLKKDLSIIVDRELEESTQSQKESSPLFKKLNKQARDAASLLLEDSLSSPKTLKKTWNRLQKWNRLLLNHARALKEDIASKQSQNLVLAGHSLGGACAQQGLVSFVVHHNRLPLPDHHIEIRSFDEPGIRAEDNETFKEFGCRHSQLLEAQGSKFRITRRQEEGDFIPIAGEEHLGAATEQEEAALAKWLSFDAAVQREISRTQDSTITSSFTAHATQFETGKRHAKWVASSAKRILKEGSDKDSQPILEIYKKAQGDYCRTWYSSAVQSSFDKGIKDKKWLSIKKLWNCDIDPEKAEGRRKLIGFFLRIEAINISSLRAKTHNSSLHGLWWNYSNRKGVFVVNERGVLTQ